MTGAAPYRKQAQMKPIENTDHYEKALKRGTFWAEIRAGLVAAAIVLFYGLGIYAMFRLL